MPPAQNQDPQNIEQEACIGYLRNQVALIRPKIIVCLGRISAMKLIREDFKITKEHGQWVEKAGTQMTAMYHPAALLRNPGWRPAAFEDLKSLRRKSGKSAPGPTRPESALSAPCAFPHRAANRKKGSAKRMFCRAFFMIYYPAWTFFLF